MKNIISNQNIFSTNNVTVIIYEIGSVICELDRYFASLDDYQDLRALRDAFHDVGRRGVEGNVSNKWPPDQLPLSLDGWQPTIPNESRKKIKLS